MSCLSLAAVVLAAGKSQRMGRNKLLLEVGGRCILDWVLDALDGSIVSEVYVVLGHKPEELRPLVEDHRAEVVFNKEYEKGMTSSINVGLSRVTADASFIVLGDQIGLDPELLERMAKALESDPMALIVSPVYKGKRGHPILFRKALYWEILSLDEGETLRDVVMKHEESHIHIDGNMWCVIDIDTPEEFERVSRLFEAGPGA